ncbi:MAG: O-antigen ligase family protein [Prevotella sp.]|nr:O-antigen ligase family protein [Prevotella sp.]
MRRYVCASVLLGSLYGVYLFKKDSADGRLLIWRCALEIVADKPLLGHGPNAVECHYMDYQAAYLKAHPESLYLLLADNVKHLYNEYLEILVRYGLVGLYRKM